LLPFLDKTVEVYSKRLYPWGGDIDYFEDLEEIGDKILETVILALAKIEDPKITVLIFRAYHEIGTDDVFELVVDALRNILPYSLDILQEMYEKEKEDYRRSMLEDVLSKLKSK